MLRGVSARPITTVNRPVSDRRILHRINGRAAKILHAGQSRRVGVEQPRHFRGQFLDVVRGMGRVPSGSAAPLEQRATGGLERVADERRTGKSGAGKRQHHHDERTEQLRT